MSEHGRSRAPGSARRAERLTGLTLRIEASSFPNQVGADQKRTITELTGDQLKYENTTVMSGGQIHVALSRLK